MKIQSTKVTLFLTYFLFGILLNSVGTVILQSVTSFGVLKSDASILEAFKDLPIAIVSFLVASRIPYFGYKNALAMAFLLICAGISVLMLMPSFWTVKLLFLMTGVAFALVKVTVYSVIGLLTRNTNEHASLMNTIEGVFMTGVLSGSLIFSAFIDVANPASLSWLNVYWLLGGVSLALFGATFFMTLPKDTSASVAPSNPLKDLEKMASLAVKPMVTVFVISAFLYVLIEQGINTWLPTFNKEILHLPNDMSIQAASLLAFCSAIGRFGSGFVMKHFRWYPVLNVCLLAMAALILIAMPLATGVMPNPNLTWSTAPLAVYIFPIIGLFMAPIYPVINSVILSALPKANHATMAGLIIVSSALGGTLGSRLIGHIFETIGGVNAFYMTLIPMLAIIVSLFFLKQQVTSLSANGLSQELDDEDIEFQK